MEWKKNFTEEQLQIRRERATAWNQTHKELVRERHKLWYMANKARITELNRSPIGREQGRARAIAFRKRNPWYNIWQGVKQRCANPKHPSYRYYGGRGIRNFLSKADIEFLWVRDSARLLTSPSIDRLDNDGNYTMENCRFIERSQNAIKRGYDNWRKALKSGETVTKEEFLKEILKSETMPK